MTNFTIISCQNVFGGGCGNLESQLFMYRNNDGVANLSNLMSNYNWIRMKKFWGRDMTTFLPEWYITQCSKIRKKSAISKVQKSENCIFGSFKLFSGAFFDFLPFLKRQIMFFCTFEIALFFLILEHYVTYVRKSDSSR